jgi:nascent polypeptide-associated complex subunit alpha
MLGGLNPKKMQAMMKQMGMSQDEIDASKVIIEKSDGSNITINNPSVARIKIQGQESFQISGEVSEATGISEEDIKTVMEKTGKPLEDVKKSLEKTDDLAESILELSD